jgi:hypothetical protein
VRVGGERITRAKGVRSDEARLDLRCPAKDRSPGTVQRGGACGVRGCQRPSLGRLTYEGLSAAYPAMTVA